MNRLTESLLSVKAGDPDTRRRGRLVAIMLLAVAALAFVYALWKVVALLVDPFGEDWLYVAESGGAAVVLLLLYWLNRRGYTTLCAWLYVVGQTVAICVFFEPSILSYAVGYLVIPVFAASFVIGPYASFPIALLAESGYCLALSTIGDPTEVGWAAAYVTMFFTAAVIAALAANSCEASLRAERALRGQAQTGERRAP